jgi:hypothetical protein
MQFIFTNRRSLLPTAKTVKKHFDNFERGELHLISLIKSDLFYFAQLQDFSANDDRARP